MHYCVKSNDHQVKVKGTACKSKTTIKWCQVNLSEMKFERKEQDAMVNRTEVEYGSSGH